MDSENCGICGLNERHCGCGEPELQDDECTYCGELLDDNAAWQLQLCSRCVRHIGQEVYYR